MHESRRLLSVALSKSGATKATTRASTAAERDVVLAVLTAISRLLLLRCSTDLHGVRRRRCSPYASPAKPVRVQSKIYQGDLDERPMSRSLKKAIRPHNVTGTTLLNERVDWGRISISKCRLTICELSPIRCDGSMKLVRKYAGSVVAASSSSKSRTAA